MKYFKILTLLTVIGFTSCGTNAQEPDNTKPMYGEVLKNDEYKKVDEKFIAHCLSQFGTIDSSVKVQTKLAWGYFYNNDLTTAMKRFNQTWILDSEYPDSYFGFAALLEMSGDNLGAKRFYEIGLEKDKTKERAKECYQRIADCKEQLQDYYGTIESYAKLTELSPNDAFAYKKIGYFQMQNGNSKEALAAYAKAIELDPKDAMTYNNRAYLYQTEKNYKNAVIDYTKAIELDSTYISAYVNRGVTQMEQNNFEEAKKDFEICVQLNSNSGELRRILGAAKLSLKDKSGACKDLELAAKLGDKMAEKLIQQNCKN